MPQSGHKDANYAISGSCDPPTWGSDQIHAYGTHDLGGNPSVSISVPIWVLRRWKVLTGHHRNKSLRRAEDLNFYDIFVAFVKERTLLSLTALNINNKRMRQLPNIGDQDR